MMFNKESRGYDYSTCTFKGKIAKLRKMNTQMAKEAKAKGVKGIQMLSVHQLTKEEEILENDSSDHS